MAEPIQIMVVDDHHIVRQGLVALIRTISDMQVVAEASDGVQAVDLYRKHRPDITLMDLRLPNKNGVEAITQIRQEFLPHALSFSLPSMVTRTSIAHCRPGQRDICSRE